MQLSFPGSRPGAGGFGGGHNVIPPTPGPSSHGQDHPWAKMFGGGTGAADAVPPTPNAHSGGPLNVSDPFGGKRPSIPLQQRRDSQNSVASRKPSLLSNSSTASQEGRGSFTTEPTSLAESPLSDTTSFSRQSQASAPNVKPVHLGPSAASWPVAAKASKAAQSDDMSKYRSTDASSLSKMMSQKVNIDSENPTPALLILDIRPSTAFASSRIAGSVNVCAPSTLLKRPGVTIDRIESEMLQSDADRAKFTRWRKGPMKDGDDHRAASSSPDGIRRIVVLDSDTSTIDALGRPSVGGGGPCLLGMLKKFDAAGYAGELFWLSGGYAEFSAFAGQNDPGNEKSLLDEGVRDESNAGAHADDVDAEAAPISQTKATKKAPVGRLRLSDLASQRHASVPHNFSPSSQEPPNLGGGARSQAQFGALPMDAFTDRTTTSGAPSRRRHQSMLLSASDSNLFSLNGKSAAGARSSAACNPFFDNIRQNRELQHGITEKIPLDLHFLTESQKQNTLPPFLQEIAGKDEKTVADQLAHDFFDIEKAEQTRLMATMRQHAAESSMDPRQSQTMGPTGPDVAAKEGASSAAADGASPVQLSSAYSRIEGVDSTTSLAASSFPFSIAAAIERGSENRYNNIWTYEHSRVPVSTGSTCGEDKTGSSVSSYLNGSFVQPLREFGAHRSYIATQAPLPTTFETFWNAVWQQNSRTIAMLTREYESGRVQSHNYWSEESYGTTVKLKTIEEVELNSKGEACTSSKKREKQDDGAAGGFFFSSTSAEEKDPNEPVMVRRKLLLSIVGSDEASKEVTHFQYIGWPDYSIPEDPEAILVFMDMVNQSQNDAHLALANSSDPGKYGDNKTSATGPLVLHCSAGVGRTGTYVVIDSVLDVLRKERRKSMGLPPLALWDNGTSSEHAEADDVDMTPAGKSSATFDFNTLQSPFKSKSSPFFSSGPERSSASTSASSLASPPNEARHGALGFPRRAEDGMLSPKSSSPNLQRGESIRSKLKRELSPSADMDLDEPAAAAGFDSAPHEPAPSAMWSPSGAHSGHQGGFSFSRAAGSLRREARARGLRRQRSDTSDDASVTTTDADTDRPSSLEDRESPMPQAVSMASSGSASARGSFSHASRLGSIGAEEGTPASAYRHTEGMDTPSRAMDGMNLGFSSSSRSSHISTPTSPFTFGSGGSGGAGGPAASAQAPTPSSFKLSLPSAAAAGQSPQPQQPQQQQQSSTTQQEPRRFSIARTTHSSASEARSSPNPPGPAPKSSTRGSVSMDASDGGKAGSGAPLCTSPPTTTTTTTSSSSSSTPHSSSSAAPVSPNRKTPAATLMSSAGEKDLIRHATHVAREQRMSSVQTQRQYVFCYLAVVKGVLREVQREREGSHGQKGQGQGQGHGQGGQTQSMGSSPFFS